MTLYLDANVFVLALSEGEKGARAVNWLQRVQGGGDESVISALVFDEVMWALIKSGKKHLVEETVKKMYSLKNSIVIGVDSEIPLMALELMKKHDLRPRDAFHLAVMSQHGIRTIISDDSDFDRVKAIARKF